MGLLDRFRRGGDPEDSDGRASYGRAVSGAAFDHNAAGLDLMQRGLISEALEEFRRGLRSSPDSAELCYNAGVAHDYLCETKRAAEFYERATKLDPEFVEAFCGLGAAYNKMGKGLEAIRACLQAIRLDPSHPDAHNALALAYFHWGSYPEAVKACRKALAVDPAYSQAHYTLGLIHVDLGERDKALAEHAVLEDSDPELAEQLFQQIPTR
jgi:tetratricopeptide (TPR) repeat protein